MTNFNLTSTRKFQSSDEIESVHEFEVVEEEKYWYDSC